MRLLVPLLLAGCQFSVRGLPLPPADAAQAMEPGAVDDLAVPDDLSISVSDDLSGLADLAEPDLAKQPDLVVNLGPASDVAEDVLTTWDVGESTNDLPVPCNPMKLGQVTLTADTVVQAGTQAVNLAYTASSYFQAVYPKGLGANWDLRTRSTLEMWVQAVEPAGYGGWSPAGPTLILCSPGGYRAISPSADQLLPSAPGYSQLLIPLSTAGLWVATDFNAFDPSHVTGFELHFDPQCGTCTISSVTVRVDNVYFY